ncbi:amino acid permease [Actinotignum urinale]|uniref:amino acid permease n=1 Tax=Actinotignum urinale TaxID=190146 RepID=UPI002A7F211A|nr:amino acid permease [Actinotignum urinale]MDY5128689.1 amino acid permease [Actinotignum urinale]
MNTTKTQTTVADSAPHVAGLHRDLRNRHIQMIALGGAIGTGLFYGSHSSLSLAGPAILLTYLVGGLTIYLVMRALGEMSVDSPVAGAFSYYAYKNWSDRAGFVSGWNYWFNYIFVAMAELSVVGVYINYWFPSVPHWLTAAFFLVFITGVNLMGVRAFGEFEFWFAAIKVFAIIGMIVLGLWLIIFQVTSPNGVTPSVSHLVDHGGFFAQGAKGAVLAFVVVMFSFGGIELIGITAGEAEHPEKSIPHAINSVIWRILLFYIGALAIIMCVVPWDFIDGNSSPFVQIFDSAGIKIAAHILNFVVITAALSVYNSGLYSNGRMLYALAEQGNAPKAFLRLSKRGTPVIGVIASSAITVVAVVIVLCFPDFAFNYLMSVALMAGLINWTMVMITQIKFRKRIGAQRAKELSFKLPGGIISSIFVLIMMAACTILMLVQESYRMSVAIGAIWLAVLLVAYEIKKRSSKKIVAHN